MAAVTVVGMAVVTMAAEAVIQTQSQSLQKRNSKKPNATNPIETKKALSEPEEGLLIALNSPVIIYRKFTSTSYPHYTMALELVL